MLAEHDVPELQKPWEAKLLEAAKQPGVWTDWDLSYDILPLVLDHGHRILHKPPQERTGREQYGLTRFFIRNYHRVIPEKRYEELRFKELDGKLDELDKEFPDVSRAMTVRRREQPRPTHVHLRGLWDRTGSRVAPDTPGFLPPLRAGAQATRVDLARWLVSRGNPLTARVTVNRIWQEYFGRGLVLTSEDFGTRGERPAHPQLLDWLGCRVHGARVEPQEAAQADRDFLDLPPVIACPPRPSAAGPRQRVAGPADARPPSGGVDSRQRARGERIALSENRGPQRAPADAAGCG